MSWESVAKRLSVSVEVLRRAIDPGFAEKRNASVRARRARYSREPTGKVHQPGWHTSAAEKRDGERLLKLVPPDTRDLTARVFGDPLPGRSALDKLSSDIGGRAG
jgi:hypothetical protein